MGFDRDLGELPAVGDFRPNQPVLSSLKDLLDGGGQVVGVCPLPPTASTPSGGSRREPPARPRTCRCGQESFVVFTNQGTNHAYRNFQTALFTNDGDSLEFSHPADTRELPP